MGKDRVLLNIVSGETAVEHLAESEKIVRAAYGAGTGFQPFRRNESQSAADPERVGHGAYEADIGEFRFPADKQDVLRFDVPVNQPVLMERLKPVEQFPAELGGLRRRKPLFLPQKIVQCRGDIALIRTEIVRELHRVVEDIVDFADVKNPDQVRSSGNQEITAQSGQFPSRLLRFFNRLQGDQRTGAIPGDPYLSESAAPAFP